MECVGGEESVQLQADIFVLSRFEETQLRKLVLDHMLLASVDLLGHVRFDCPLSEATYHGAFECNWFSNCRRQNVSILLAESFLQPLFDDRIKLVVEDV